jgi:hypothetical protein
MAVEPQALAILSVNMAVACGALPPYPAVFVFIAAQFVDEELA